MNITVKLSAALALAATSCVLADTLDIRPGLWQMSTSTQTAGSMLPQGMLDKLTPEQREKMTAAMQQRAAAGPHVRTNKRCVTAEDLKKGAFKDQAQGPNCKQTIIAQTSRRQEMMLQCTGDEAHAAKMTIEAVDSTHVKGTMDAATAQGRMSMQLDGTWLSASCAGAEK